MGTSYWLNEANNYDHSELVEIASRIFNRSMVELSFYTTDSLRKAIVYVNTRKLQRRGW